MPASIRRRASARRARAARAPKASADSPTRSATSSARFSARGGGRGRGNGVYRGADLRYNLELSLEEAARGTEAKIRIPALEDCATCHGSGAKPGTQPKTCPTCNGQGQVRVSQGFFSIQQTCPQCHGTGKIIPEPCTTCGGAGRVKKHKTLSVKIPAGVDQDDRIRLARRRRGRVERRPAGRPVRRGQPEAASGVPAREQRSALRDADQLRHVGARRRNRDSDARRPRQDQDSGGNAERTGLPPARQGHQGRAQPARTAICSATSRSRRRSS